MSTEEFIKNYLMIDSDSPTGLRWTGHSNKAHRTRFAGKPAGKIDNKGYNRTRVQGRHIYNHRIVWLLRHGKWPEGQIDHIDGCRTNNHPENLRDVRSYENNHNRIDCGYTWHKRDRKWQARIQVNGQNIHLGYFSSAEAARSAYLGAKARLHKSAPERCFSHIKHIERIE